MGECGSQRKIDARVASEKVPGFRCPCSLFLSIETSENQPVTPFETKISNIKKPYWRKHNKDEKDINFIKVKRKTKSLEKGRDKHT